MTPISHAAACRRMYRNRHNAQYSTCLCCIYTYTYLPCPMLGTVSSVSQNRIFEYPKPNPNKCSARCASLVRSRCAR